MSSALSRVLFLPLALLFPAVIAAAEPPSANVVRTNHAWAEIVASVTSILPRDSFSVALRLRPDSGWHVYWSNPGDAGMPPSLGWALPHEWSAGPLLFPLPERFETPPLASFGYKDDVWYPAKMFAGGADAGTRVPLRARAEWLICREECLPESADFTVTLDMEKTVPHPVDAARMEDFAFARLPRPQPEWNWTVAYADTTVTIAWDLAASRDDVSLDENVFFFPAELGVVVHAAPQTLRITDNRAHLTMKRDDVLHLRPEVLHGVIVFDADNAGARRGYELALSTGSAAGASRPGLVPALLVGLLSLAVLILIIVVKRPHVDSTR